MIDEELYKIATDELNSDDRNPAVWARACALASDDHDEARFLYTNLRVEEMLNKDGKQRTFSTTRKAEQEDLSSSDELDTLELTLDGDEVVPESSRTGVSSHTAPLPIDDLLSYDENDANVPTSVAGNAIETSDNDTFDAESIAELESLAKKNNSTTESLSSLTGELTTQHATAGQDDQNDYLLGDDLLVAGVIDSNTVPNMPSPESKRTALLSENLERQARDMGDSVDEPLDESIAETTYSENKIDAGHHDTILTDYADNNILDDDLILDDDSSLDTGVGRSFMVFSRDGGLKAIKRGASWPALFFTFPWLLSKALFGTALVYGCLWLVSLAGLLTTVSLWLNTSPNATLMIKLWTLGFGLLALIGLLYIPFRYGNSWVADKLQNRGYEYEAAVSASSKREAMSRLMNPTD